MDTNHGTAADTADRRHFQRIASDKRVLLRSWDAEHDGNLLDISLRGLLIEVRGHWQPFQGERVHVHVQLDGELSCIDMHAVVARCDHGRIGLRCVEMDVESAARLRRLVELNLADPALLERDIEQLLAGG